MDRPYVAQAIAVAALYGDLERQCQLARELMKDITDAMFMRGEKSLDLLEGLLVTIAWYHYHVFQNPQTSNLYHLVASLLVDLGLNCPPDRLNDQKLRLPTRLLQSPIGRRESRSMPELRALLGCYYTSSVIWCAFKKLETVPYSPHIESACNALEHSQELSSDALIVHLVRGQRLLERVERGIEQGPAPAAEERIQAAMTFVETYEHALYELKSHVPKDLGRHSNLQMLHLCTLTTLHEIAFTHLNTLSLLKAPPPTTTTSNIQSRTNHHLHAALRAIADFFTLYTTHLHPEAYFAPAFDFWARLSHTLLALARLSSIPEVRQIIADSKTNSRKQRSQSVNRPSKDNLSTQHAHAYLTFEEIVQKAASAWEEAEAAARAKGLPLGENHLFTRWAARLRSFCDAYVDGGGGDGSSGGVGAREGGGGGGDGVSGSSSGRRPSSNEGGVSLQRLNAAATFPGHDPAIGLSNVADLGLKDGRRETNKMKGKRRRDEVEHEEQRPSSLSTAVAAAAAPTNRIRMGMPTSSLTSSSSPTTTSRSAMPSTSTSTSMDLQNTGMDMTMSDQEREELSNQGWDVEKLVSYNEGLALQCPVS